MTIILRKTMNILTKSNFLVYLIAACKHGFANKLLLRKPINWWNSDYSRLKYNRKIFRKHRKPQNQYKERINFQICQKCVVIQTRAYSTIFVLIWANTIPTLEYATIGEDENKVRRSAQERRNQKYIFINPMSCEKGFLIIREFSCKKTKCVFFLYSDCSFRILFVQKNSISTYRRTQFARTLSI